MSGYRDRFKEAPWYNPEIKVTIGGLGSIGSWLTIFLGRMLDHIYVYDFDEVEEHNISGQFYTHHDIGVSKQQSIDTNSSMFNPETKIVKRGRFTEDSGVTPICFACCDNMEARNV